MYAGITLLGQTGKFLINSGGTIAQFGADPFGKGYELASGIAILGTDPAALNQLIDSMKAGVARCDDSLVRLSQCGGTVLGAVIDTMVGGKIIGTLAEGTASAQLTKLATGPVDDLARGVTKVDEVVDLAKIATRYSYDDLVRISKEFGWRNPDTLLDHFIRHGDDFGARTVEEYARMAGEFKDVALTNAFKRGYNPLDESIEYYDSTTNTFLAIDPLTGGVKTIFKPTDGYDYIIKLVKQGRWTGLDY